MSIKSIREIVLDTETTGLSASSGDRIVEIAAIELIDNIPSGKIYHQYINPERDMGKDALRVHGLTEDFLKNYPIFSEIVGDFLSFIDAYNKTDIDYKLIIHNAPFDVGFINYELNYLSYPCINNEIIDTMKIARKKFPGSSVSLDALCRKFKIDLSKRSKHSALIDCELLAKVYLELIGGAQTNLINTNDASSYKDKESKVAFKKRDLKRRFFSPYDDEINEHNLIRKRLFSTFQ